MPKQSGTRSTLVKRKAARKSATGIAVRQRQKEILPREENITKYAEYARGLVLAAWSEIVQGLIKKAADGGYQQAKLLLDLCDLTNMDASQLNEQRRQQLCDVLLEGLGLSPEQPERRGAE